MNRDYKNLFIKLAQWNRLEELTYLVELYPDLKNKIEHAFHSACRNGHLETAQWLYQIKNVPDSDYGFHWRCCFAFQDACSSGRLEVVQWLYQILQPRLLDLAFRNACSNGHLQVAQWLYQMNPSINISALEEYAFRYACINGHLEVAQWLYQIKPTLVIHEDVFKNACSKGQLQVAQWLYQIKPTLYTYAVYESIVPWIEYSYRLLEVAQWLQSLCPDGLFLNGTVQLRQEEDTTCSICTENSVTVQTHCKHNYCKECLTKWVSSHSTCPYCRDPIRKVYSITHT